MRPISRNEQWARDKKVNAIIAVLVDSARQVGAELTVESLEGLDWHRAALIAGVRPPSATSIAVIKERVRTGQIGRRVATCKCGKPVEPGTFQCKGCADAEWEEDKETMNTLKEQREDVDLGRPRHG